MPPLPTRRGLVLAGVAGTLGPLASTPGDKANLVGSESRGLDSFGAAGDGQTDDTSAFQRAIDWACIRNGRELVISGSHRISRSLIIGSSDGWVIRGVARGVSRVLQAQENEPVFTFTGDLTHGWAIRDVTIGHVNRQPFYFSASTALLFDGPSHSNIFNFEVCNCTFINSRRGIAQSGGKRIQQAIWGVRIVGCTATGSLSGAFIRLMPSTAVGQPSIAIRDCYVDCETSSFNENAITIGYCDNVLIEMVEFNRGKLTAGVANLFIYDSTGVIISSKTEDVDLIGGQAIWVIEQSDIVVMGCKVIGVRGGAEPAAAIAALSGASVSLNAFTLMVQSATEPVSVYRRDAQSEVMSIGKVRVIGPLAKVSS